MENSETWNFCVSAGGGSKLNQPRRWFLILPKPTWSIAGGNICGWAESKIRRIDCFIDTRGGLGDQGEWGRDDTRWSNWLWMLIQGWIIWHTQHSAGSIVLSYTASNDNVPTRLKIVIWWWVRREQNNKYDKFVWTSSLVRWRQPTNNVLWRVCCLCFGHSAAVDEEEVTNMVSRLVPSSRWSCSEAMNDGRLTIL